MTSNQTPTGGEFPLFRTSMSIEGAPAFIGALGYRVSPVLSLEAGVELGQPQLRTVVTEDVEAEGATTVTETLTQVIIDGAVVVRLPRLALGRAVPFVRGGVGYLRQLDEERNAVETGRVYSAGGGLTLPLVIRPRGWLNVFGLRGDVRAVWYDGGFDPQGDRGVGVMAGAGVLLRF